MSKSLEEHAENWDLRHEDFNDNDFLYRVYEIMRTSAPFVRTDAPFLGAAPSVWVATRYQDCYEILRDWGHFSSNWQRFADQPSVDENLMELGRDSVISLDPPHQQTIRKVLNPYFSPGRIKQLEPQIRAVTDELIDSFIEFGTGDLGIVSRRQPGTVFFKHILGMPVEEVPHYLDLVDAAINGEDLEARTTAMFELSQKVRDAMAERRVQPPRDDLIDALFAAEIDGEQFPFEDAVANVMLFVQAGLDTTSNATSFAFHYFGLHPDERDRFIGRPELLPTAVEEFIRYGGSVHGIHRTVAEKVELSGHTFCPGETIVVNYAAANRDPAEFSHADRCVLDRQNNRHIGFGAGVHRCLGSNLARLELQVALEQVLSRMPDYTITDDTKSVFVGNSVVRGYRTIPVEFSPGRAGSKSR